MSRKQKKTLVRILISGALFAGAFFIPVEGIWKLGVYLIPYFVIGWDVLWKAVRNISHGQVFDENFLMSIATIGAFCVGEYPEGVAVMLFYQVGELFQSYSVGRSRQSIAALMDIRPYYANLEKPDGSFEQVDPDEVNIGDIIIVKAGEKIPLDGVVVEGISSLNTSALTGESVPRGIKPGKEVISGCINLNGLLRVKVTKEFGESTVAKILDLVENSSSKKAKSENFITKFARYYTPVVVIGALLLAVIPPLILGGGWNDWIGRALIFLVISCPCALVISIPLSFFGGIGGASKKGILVKGGNYLEALSQTELVVFDKTGTLTKGIFQVSAVHPGEIEEKRLLELAADHHLHHHVQLDVQHEPHPRVADVGGNQLQPKREVHRRAVDATRVSDVEEMSGRGVKALVDGQTIWAGNGKLMDLAGAKWRECHLHGTVVHVAAGSEYLGHIVISDQVKEDAAQAVQELKALGVRKTVMLTGDKAQVAKEVARQLGVDEVHAELLPGDKVQQVESLLKEKSGKGKLAFVGDGINDAPVLSRADIGIAMGGLGSDAAIEAADIVLMDDHPSKIAEAIRISKKTLRLVKENIVFALAVKVLCLALGAVGLANMWEAVFADVGVSVIAILNASRALKVKTKSQS